jgi:hypothetical protein
MDKIENIKWMIFSLHKSKNSFTESKSFKIKLWIAFIHASINLTILFTIQFFSCFRPKKRIKQYIILGSLAPHHHNNIFRFLNFNSNEGTLINTYNKNSIVSIQHIGFLPLYRELINNFHAAQDYLINMNDSYDPNEIIHRVSKSSAIYSYFYLLFRHIKYKFPEIKIYSGGAELASLAAIRNNLSTNYLSHGLIGVKALANENFIDFIEEDISDKNYPQYSSIYVYSDFEKKFLKSKLTKSKIIKYPFKPLKNLQRSVILFFEITEDFFDETEYLNIIEFFKKNSFQIYGKEHPVNPSNFQKRFCDHNNIKLINGRQTAYEIINEKNPMFTLGWPSTSLCESLNLGVIPICIPDNHPFFKFKNFYPFPTKTLSWKKDLNLIKDAISSKTEYYHCLEKLRKE